MPQPKRWFPKRDTKLPKGYDSALEYFLHEGPLKEAQHHVPKEDLIPYSIPHTYQLDFMFDHDRVLFLVESKGRFRDSAEARKYTYIREYLEDWRVFRNSGMDRVELFFIFENSATPMPFAKKRKDGSKNSHSDWATRNHFRWLCKKRGDLVGVDSSESLVKRLGELN